MSVRAINLVGTALACAAVSGCAVRELPLQVRNDSQRRIDVIALLSRHSTSLGSYRRGYFSNRGLRAYAVQVEPEAAWSSREAQPNDVLHDNIVSGTSGWLIVLVRYSDDVEHEWHNLWIKQPQLYPVVLEVGQANGQIEVMAIGHDGAALEIVPMTEDYLRNWNPHMYTSYSGQFSLLDILDSRANGLPLQIEER